MRFVFWQDIISIHQSAFLKALAESYDVELVVKERFDQKRAVMGWGTPDTGKVRVYVDPAESEIEQILSPEKINIFSGIDFNPLVFKCLKLAIKKQFQVVVILEPYRWMGFVGWMRRAKYYNLRKKFGSNIKLILTTGAIGRKCYCAAGFPNGKIYDWGYFVETKYSEYLESAYKKIKPNILFVGSLDERKNVLNLLDICKNIHADFNELSLVGDGPLKEQVLGMIAGCSSIKYLGVLSNDDVRVAMHQNDILILPSLFDGWGAVVNEALQAGMRVIASENCGASVLLDGFVRGESFSYSDKQRSLQEVLIKWLKKGSLTAEERLKISNWSDRNISGKSAAKYFVDVISYEYGGSALLPHAPWLSN